VRLVLLLPLFALTLPAAELDVTKVVLYKHGVGYFERAGDVGAGDQAALQFKAEEMDDVLKSLTVRQTGGEGVSAVRYDSSDPLSKRLQVFPFHLGSGVALHQILDQFKGADIELLIGSERVVGTILSARGVPPSEDQGEMQQLLLLADGAILTVDPQSAGSIRFLDAKIQTQFSDYLSVISRSRNTEKRSVTIESEGGASRVAASYVVPTPIWKTSYRLVFDAQDEPLMEGWAIVDNTSGEDWENVRLSLVSGLPVSFISRLYEPRYLQRPVVQLAQDRAVRPTVYSGAIEEQEMAADQAGVVAGLGGFAGGRLAPSPAAKSMAYRQNVAAAPMSESVGADTVVRSSSLAATAERAELGDLFEYAIEKPVTIRKSESAMLPFFGERVEARRLYIYDDAQGSQHPMNAAEITNNTDATLDGGAITVYDAGAYAGEALVETIKAGDKRLISYAVDLGTRITTAFDSDSKLQSEIHLSRGVLTTKTAVRETKTFTVRNVDDSAKTIVIEHPVRPGFTLVGMKASETTAKAYRFEVAVDADALKKFAVVEERVYSQSHAITSMNPDQLVSWVNNKELDAAGRDKLGEILTAKREMADLQLELERTDQRVNELGQDQGRLRNNISTLRSVAGQQQKVQEYAENLAATDGEIVRLNDRRADLRSQIDESQRAINALIESLEF